MAYRVASKLVENNYDLELVNDIVKIACKYEGCYDLLVLLDEGDLDALDDIKYFISWDKAPIVKRFTRPKSEDIREILGRPREDVAISLRYDNDRDTVQILREDYSLVDLPVHLFDTSIGLLYQDLEIIDGGHAIRVGERTVKLDELFQAYLSTINSIDCWVRAHRSLYPDTKLRVPKRFLKK